MAALLPVVVQQLKEAQPQLQRRGVLRICIFGSVARGEEQPGSDIELLLDLNEQEPLSVFEYSRLKLELQAMLSRPADIVSRKNLKPYLRESVLSGAVHVF